MENEIIEYYTGDFITVLGRPHLLLVGYEEGQTLVCEKYILFEELNGSHTLMGEKIIAPKIEGAFDDLEEFMKNQGLEHAKSVIFIEAYKEAEKRNDGISMNFALRGITLRKTTQTSFLLYFKQKAVSQLDWVVKNTDSEKLKSIIEFYKSITVTHRRIGTD
ncbi:MAG: hypothetical protein AAGJ93_03900 [Bacteroidota bacterium]